MEFIQLAHLLRKNTTIMKSIILTLCIAFLSGFHSEVNVQITGTVFDQRGKTPLYGAMVSVKGTNTSTKTGFDGRYSITG